MEGKTKLLKLLGHYQSDGCIQQQQALSFIQELAKLSLKEGFSLAARAVILLEQGQSSASLTQSLAEFIKQTEPKITKFWPQKVINFLKRDFRYQSSAKIMCFLEELISAAQKKGQNWPSSTFRVISTQQSFIDAVQLLTLKQLFCALFMDQNSIKYLSKSQRLTQILTPQELGNSLYRLVQTGAMGTLPYRKIQQKFIAAFCLMVQSLQRLTREAILKLLMQPYFDFLNLVRLWPSYKKMLASIKLSFNRLNVLTESLSPSSVPELLQHQLKAHLHGLIRNLPSQRSLSLLQLYSQYFQKDFLEFAIKELSQNNMHTELFDSWEHLLAAFTSLQKLQENSALLMELLLFKYGVNYRSRFILQFFKRLKTYSVIAFKALPLPQSVTKLICEQVITQLKISKIKQIQIYLKVLKCLRSFPGTNILQLLLQVTFAANEESSFQLINQVWLQLGTEQLCPHQAYILVKKVTDKFINSKLSSRSPVVALIIRTLNIYHQIIPLFFKYLFYKIKRSDSCKPDIRLQLQKYYFKGTLDFVDQNRLGIKNLVIPQASEISGNQTIQILLYGQLILDKHSKILATFKERFLNFVGSCESKCLKKLVFGSERFRKLCYRTLDKQLNGPVVDELVQLLIAVTTKLVNQKLTSDSQMQSLYQVLIKLQKVIIPCRELLSVKSYRCSLSEIVKNNSAERWIVAAAIHQQLLK